MNTFMDLFLMAWSFDHKCRITRCWNPDHVEPVTHEENMARGAHALKTHCPHGHSYSEDNTRISSRGSRLCKTCGNIDSGAAETQLAGRGTGSGRVIQLGRVTGASAVTATDAPRTGRAQPEPRRKRDGMEVSEVPIN